MRRIGIYPGTFDPVHEGHLAFARAALETHGLDTIFFAPEPKPRGKHLVTDVRHRLAMLEQATNDTSQFASLQLLSHRFTASETLPELQRLFPNDTLALLIGSDVARSLAYWDDLVILASTVEFIIGLRMDDTPAKIDAIVQSITTPVRYSLITSGQAHATSSVIRSGNHTATPPEVRDYITQHQLYAK
jgi:nicotinate-nucleotide adenylyltransferase